MEEAVRWNITVSKETDLTLRTFLGVQASEEDAFSKFVEEAVRWRLFRLTMQDVRERNAGTDPDELQRIIDETVSDVRRERYQKGTSDKA
jgi:hypothetical protein